jgi:hypothetical protein
MNLSNSQKLAISVHLSCPVWPQLSNLCDVDRKIGLSKIENMRRFGALKIARFVLIAVCSAFVVKGPLAQKPAQYIPLLTVDEAVELAFGNNVLSENRRPIRLASTDRC